MKNQAFFRSVCALAIPAALQSMLQASFSVADQVMIGQLGSVEVAAVGLAGKFMGIFSVAVAAISTVAGILIAQYMGQRRQDAVKRSLQISLCLAGGLALIFTLLCLFLPRQIMGLYTDDPEPVTVAAGYLVLVAGTFFPAAGTSVLSTQLRCMERAMLPLGASFASVVANTGLNYVLIFGKAGFPSLGVTGAALATLISQILCFVVIAVMYLRVRDWSEVKRSKGRFPWGQYVAVLMPVLLCEVLWSLGENVYAAIYGHLGTEACAAMTLTNPVQSLAIGALGGLSQAAGVLIGKRLGDGAFEDAIKESRLLALWSAMGAVFLSVLIFLARPLYVQFFAVEDSVRNLTMQILVAYALVFPFKVENMVVEGGVLRSGGETKYTCIIDLVGTWCFGVPLGPLAAFRFHLPIPAVYFILSLEECIRVALTAGVFHSRKWMSRLKTEAAGPGSGED